MVQRGLFVSNENNIYFYLLVFTLLFFIKGSLSGIPTFKYFLFVPGLYKDIIFNMSARLSLVGNLGQLSYFWKVVV